MKKNIKLILAVVVALVSVSTLSAQKANKFGHIDFAALYDLMPEKDSVAKVYENYIKDIESQLMAMGQELQTKMSDYEKNQAGMSDIIRQTKEKEIYDLNQRIQDFRATGEQQLALKEAELMSPLIEKARKAVEEVAKANGYTYIFNSTGGILIYAEPSDDIMDLVKKKLNL
ncbi:MAG: OmpH family outer membrane protein [Bacteroidales bacterium]|jgi:outer membrane protein